MIAFRVLFSKLFFLRVYSFLESFLDVVGANVDK